uniref:Uncharacterized protein n=1 Tax=Trypanosoma congolense (strain IL3000) TaxID=1068625 RepID=G0USW2_TRYCI|nr:conserved hypothetical protein [Trypanosoma congolense IL3000]
MRASASSRTADDHSGPSKRHLIRSSRSSSSGTLPPSRRLAGGVPSTIKRPNTQRRSLQTVSATSTSVAELGTGRSPSPIKILIDLRSKKERRASTSRDAREQAEGARGSLTEGESNRSGRAVPDAMEQLLNVYGKTDTPRKDSFRGKTNLLEAAVNAVATAACKRHVTPRFKINDIFCGQPRLNRASQLRREHTSSSTRDSISQLFQPHSKLSSRAGSRQSAVSSRGYRKAGVKESVMAAALKAGKAPCPCSAARLLSEGEAPASPRLSKDPFSSRNGTWSAIRRNRRSAEFHFPPKDCSPVSPGPSPQPFPAVVSERRHSATDVQRRRNTPLAHEMDGLRPRTDAASDGTPTRTPTKQEELKVSSTWLQAVTRETEASSASEVSRDGIPKELEGYERCSLLSISDHMGQGDKCDAHHATEIPSQPREKHGACIPHGDENVRDVNIVNVSDIRDVETPENKHRECGDDVCNESTSKDVCPPQQVIESDTPLRGGEGFASKTVTAANSRAASDCPEKHQLCQEPHEKDSTVAFENSRRSSTKGSSTARRKQQSPHHPSPRVEEVVDKNSAMSQDCCSAPFGVMAGFSLRGESEHTDPPPLPEVIGNAVGTTCGAVVCNDPHLNSADRSGATLSKIAKSAVLSESRRKAPVQRTRTTVIDDSSLSLQELNSYFGGGGEEEEELVLKPLPFRQNMPPMTSKTSSPAPPPPITWRECRAAPKMLLSSGATSGNVAASLCSSPLLWSPSRIWRQEGEILVPQRYLVGSKAVRREALSVVSALMSQKFHEGILLELMRRYFHTWRKFAKRTPKPFTADYQRIHLMCSNFVDDALRSSLSAKNVTSSVAAAAAAACISKIQKEAGVAWGREPRSNVIPNEERCISMGSSHRSICTADTSFTYPSDDVSTVVSLRPD